MRSYPVKENPIGSAISEILLYNHTNTLTNRQASCYFSIRNSIFAPRGLKGHLGMVCLYSTTNFLFLFKKKLYSMLSSLLMYWISFLSIIKV